MSYHRFSLLKIVDKPPAGIDAYAVRVRATVLDADAEEPQGSPAFWFFLDACR
jgi:hypothetical protein